MQEAILEADDDEAKDDAAEGEGTENASPDEAAADDAKSEGGNDDSSLTDDTPFAGLDLRKAHCFGFQMPEKSCWKSLADQADDIGWELIDKRMLEKSLTRDVEDSYMKIAQFKLTNVDDGMSYDVWFDNNKQLWNVEIANSPMAEISPEERKDFFASELFKKIAKKTYGRLNNAKETYVKQVQPHLENAELMLVDTVKLDVIIRFLDSEHFLDNLLNCKYLSY